MTLIVLGAYTIIYLIVFLIQKSEIDKLKEIIASMKTFIDIFKIDEIKKYVELKTERVKMDIEKIVSDDKRLRQMMDEVLDENAEAVRKVYFKQLNEQNMEMLSIIIDVLRSLPKEKRAEFVKARLKINQEVYLAMLSEMD